MCPICLSGLVIALGSAGALGGAGVAAAKRWSSGRGARCPPRPSVDPQGRAQGSRCANVPDWGMNRACELPETAP